MSKSKPMQLYEAYLILSNPSCYYEEQVNKARQLLNIDNIITEMSRKLEYNLNEDITIEDSIKVLESLVESRKKYNTLYYNIEIKALEAGIKALKDKVSE